MEDVGRHALQGQFYKILAISTFTLICLAGGHEFLHEIDALDPNFNYHGTDSANKSDKQLIRKTRLR